MGNRRDAAATESTKCPARRRSGRGGPPVRAVGLAAVGIALVLGTPPALHAQAENGWVGKRVVQRYRGFRLRIEDQVIDPRAINTYRVEQVNGPWLWLQAEGRASAAGPRPTRSSRSSRPSSSSPITSGPTRATRTAIRCEPSSGEEKKELDNALADLNEAIRLDPTNAAATATAAPPGRQGGVRPGHRRLRPGHPARPQSAMAYTPPRQSPGTPRGSTTRPSPTSTRPSGSTPRSRRSPTSTAATPGPTRRRVRQGHRRLHRGHPARPEARRRLQQPRRRLGGQEGVRQGHRRLRPRPSGSTPSTPAPTTTAATPGRPRRSTTRPSPTTPRPSGSTPSTAAAYSQPRHRLVAAKQEYDKAIADFDRGHPTRPRSSPSPTTTAASPGRRSRSTTRRSPITTEAIRLDPKYALAYSNRGTAWEAKQEYDRAIADYTEAIRLDPKHALAYNNRGIVWSEQEASTTRRSPTTPRPSGSTPSYAPAYNGRAWLWATCPDAKYRDGKRAVESATRACELSEWKEAERHRHPRRGAMPRPATSTPP